MTYPIGNEVLTVTKFVRLHTIEHGIRQAFTILGDRGVEAVLEDFLGLKRSASLIRKCGDPDNETNHIQQRYAVALDVGCARAGYRPPLLQAHRSLVGRLSGGIAGAATAGGVDLLSAVLLLQRAVGHLAQAVLDARGPLRRHDRRLTNRETHELFDVVLDIERQTERLKHLLTHEPAHAPRAQITGTVGGRA